MTRVSNGIFVLVVAALAMTAVACGQSGPAPNAGQTPSARPGGATDVDRTVLPIAEPTRPAITELDARNAKAPPIFEVKAPAGAPNVLVILLDNFGYAGSTTFGGVMHLPTIERLAKNGLTYTNFHTAPICSASRVALLTGRNPHSANMGTISEMATGFPGQTSILPNSVAPLAKILRFNGYSTAMFGKSHEYVPWESGLTGPFDQWPTGLGFERFYGNVIGESDQFSPVAHDNTTLAPPSKDPNYYYQTDLADRAIQWIKAQKSLNPDKPFFVYYPAQGMHDPVQLPKAWRDKYKGKFDQGWDKYREEILARQKKLGIVPQNTKLTPKADIAPDWDTLTADEKKVAIRYQELFAAFAELTDYEIGRVVQAIEDVGVLDNTLIIYVTGDNGASPNGGRLGVFNTMSTFNQSPETLEYQLETLDEVGGPHSAMTPPAGWSFGDNTPFAYSQLHTQLGGTTNGAIVSWPKGIKAKGEIRNQYHHLIDIAPTVLAAAGLPQPKTVNGVVQKPIEGVSMMYSFDDAQAKSARTTSSTTRSTATAASTRTAGTPRPCTRCRGSRNRARSYADDKWDLCNTDGRLQLFHRRVGAASRQAQGVAGGLHGGGDQVQRAAARRSRPGAIQRHARRASRVHGRPDVADALSGHDRDEGERLHRREEPEFLDHRRARERAASGVIVAQGGAHSGWSLYVKDGRPTFAYNFLGAVTTITSSERLPAGPVTLTYDFAYDGGKPGAGGTGTLSINGKKVGSGRIERTIPFIYGVETADVGMDLYTAVTPDYATGDNQFTGKIKQVIVSVKSDAAKPDAGAIRHIPE